MEIHKFIIIRGLPSSGKTSLANELASEDSIRLSIQELGEEEYWNLLEKFSSIGFDIILDDLNLDESFIKRIEEYVKETNEWLELSPANYRYEVEIIDKFCVPLSTCIERDSKKDKPLGAITITSIFNKYKDKILPWKYLG